MAHPLHRFHTGKDECDAVISAGPRISYCNQCRKVLNAKPSFRCLPCNFALCSECNKGLIHPAHLEHRLFLIDRPDSSWTCGGCEKTREQITEHARYFCEECNFSLCKECFQPIKRPVHNHWLTRTDVRYTYSQSNGEWRCDHCGGNNGAQNYFPRHCSTCQFDVCDACSRGRSTHLHEHLLFKADSTLIYQEYYGGWRCDNCFGRFRPDINNSPYHCPECSYDMCESCLRDSEHQVTSARYAEPSVSNKESRRELQPHIITRTTAGYPVTTPVEETEEQVTAPTADDPDLCVVCLSEKRDATIVHGETGHVCCCFACAQELRRRNAACPICRAPIELIIKQFST